MEVQVLFPAPHNPAPIRCRVVFVEGGFILTRSQMRDRVRMVQTKEGIMDHQADLERMSADELRTLYRACVEVNAELEARLQVEVQYAGDHVRIKIAHQLLAIIAVLALVMLVGLSLGIIFRAAVPSVHMGLSARVHQIAEMVVNGALTSMCSFIAMIIIVLQTFNYEAMRRTFKVLRGPSIELLLLPVYTRYRRWILASLGLAIACEVMRMNITQRPTGLGYFAYLALEIAGPVFLALSIGLFLRLFLMILSPESKKSLPAKPAPVDFN